AVICADSFHVIKQLNDSLSKVRIRIMKRYDTASIEYYLLKHFRFLLFERNIDLDNKARWNKKLERYINLRQLKEELLSIDPQLKRAYELKEDYTSFNASSSYEEAEEKLGKLIDEFTLANIPEYEEFTSSLRRWKKEIVNSFRLYKGRRISNGVAESINSLISLLLFNSKGIRNSERRKKRIMYAVNKEGFLLK
ncbi:MAG: transposase, partial [Erysipelotrichaceae bacterium]|nr:transposase [Erysipelotrichaceae bacterium]